MALEELNWWSNQSKQSLDASTQKLVWDVKVSIGLTINRDNEELRKVIDLVKKSLSTDKSNACDNLARAKHAFNWLNQEQMQEQHGQSWNTKQEVLDWYQENYDKYVNAIKTLEKLLNWENVTKEEVERDRKTILWSVSREVSWAQDNLARAKHAFNWLNQEQMQEQHGQSWETKQQVLDWYQGWNDKITQAKDFIEWLFTKFN